jgi:hypothetical protein
LCGADHQLGAADAKLGAPLGQFAYRIGRRLPARRTGLDVDRQPGFGLKPLPQRGVVSGILELCRTAQLQHERIGGRGICQPGHRQRHGAGYYPRHRASPHRVPVVT